MRYGWLAAKALVSVGLLWLLARSVGIRAILEQLAGLHAGLAALGVAILLLQLWLGAVRWRLVGSVYGPAKPVGLLVRFCFVAQLFSQVLPATLGGDAVRIWLYYKDGGTLRSAILGIVTDRAFGVVGLMLVVAAALHTEEAERLDSVLRGGVALLVAGGFTGLAALLLVRKLPERWLAWSRATRVARDLAEGIRGLVARQGDAAIATGTSVGIHLASIVSCWFLAAALGIDVGAVVLAVTVPLAILVSMVPITVSGWGLREGTLVALLGVYGVPADSALVLSLCFGLALALVSLPGAFFWVTVRPGAARVAAEVERGYEAL